MLQATQVLEKPRRRCVGRGALIHGVEAGLRGSDRLECGFEPKLAKQSSRFVLTPHHRDHPRMKRRSYACGPRSGPAFYCIRAFDCRQP